MIERIKVEFINKLKKLISTWSDNYITETEKGNEFEATKERIKSNIGNILMQLFLLSYKNVSENGNLSKFKDIHESNKSKPEKLYNMYLLLINDTREPWILKASRDKEFGLEEEWFKENTKIQTSQLIENLFVSIYGVVTDAS